MTYRLTIVRQKDAWPRVYRDGKPTEFYLDEGSFTGTSDDRAGRWYIQSDHDDFSDRRGPGCRTQAEALASLREIIDLGEMCSQL